MWSVTATEELGFITSFSTFEENEKSANPLAKEVIRYMEDSTKTSISWNVTSFTSEWFKSDFGEAVAGICIGSNELIKIRDSRRQNERSLLILCA